MGKGIGLPYRRGFFNVDRHTLTTEIIGNKARMAVWLYITGEVSYAPGHWRDRNEVILLKSGDLVCSIRLAAKACGMARETFKRVLLELQQKGLIKFRALKTGTVIQLLRKVSDALLRPRGRAEAHKERKDLTQSYKHYDLRSSLSAAQRDSLEDLNQRMRAVGVGNPTTTIPDACRSQLARIFGAF